MQFRVFSLPAAGDVEAEAAFNTFLRSHRAVSVQRELVQNGGSAHWCFCVEYIEGPQGTVVEKGEGRRRVDYKERLSGPDFALFVQLRDLRKKMSVEEAIPVYAICTNEQLAAMAERRPTSISELRAIEGLGDAKAETTRLATGTTTSGSAWPQARWTANASTEQDKVPSPDNT